MLKNFIMILFKAKGAEIRDKGTLVDGSKKLELFVNELTDSQVVELNKLVRDKAVDIIVVPSGFLSDIENVIDQVSNIISVPDDPVFNSMVEIEEP